MSEKDVLLELQKKEKEMLAEVSKILDNAGIKYFVACGTCLGTIRHKGFIPWDDDVDIYIFGTDYERAKSLFVNHQKLEWHDNETHSEYPFTFPKIIAKGTVLIEEGKNDISYREGVYIDVFPLMETPKSSICLFLNEKIRYFRYAIIRLTYTDFKSKPRKILRSIAKKFFNPQKLQKKTFDSYKKSRKGDKILIDSGVFGVQARLYKEDFKDSLSYPFEDLFVSVPKNYQHYLTNYYGDYMQMPPPEKRVPCHSINYLLIDGKEIVGK